jgi:hypothetical protein
MRGKGTKRPAGVSPQVVLSNSLSGGNMFETKGDLPEWQMIYNRIENLAPLTMVSYDDLDEILGRDFRSNRSPLDRASKQLEDINRRTLRNVRGVGYQIAEAHEHADLGIVHRKRAKRQFGKGLRKTGSADYSQMTPDQAKRNQAVDMTLRTLKNNVSEMERRQNEMEKTLVLVKQETSLTREHVRLVHEDSNKLREELRSRGIDVAPPVEPTE